MNFFLYLKTPLDFVGILVAEKHAQQVDRNALIPRLGHPAHQVEERPQQAQPFVGRIVGRHMPVDLDQQRGKAGAIDFFELALFEKRFHGLPQIGIGGEIAQMPVNNGGEQGRFIVAKNEFHQGMRRQNQVRDHKLGRPFQGAAPFLGGNLAVLSQGRNEGLVRLLHLWMIVIEPGRTNSAEVFDFDI